MGLLCISGRRENMGRRSGAWIMGLIEEVRCCGAITETSVPGERHHRRRAIHCEYRGTTPLVLYNSRSVHMFISITSIASLQGYSHRLKLLTGVDTSTRPVNRSGNDGNKHMRSSRRTKATPNTPTMRLSTAMLSCSAEVQ